MIEKLPAYKGPFITAEDLVGQIRSADVGSCRDTGGRPRLTLLDLRTESAIAGDAGVAAIKTDCPTIRCLLDDLRNPAIRGRIPKGTPVVTITETGNRDKFAMQYLSGFGYTNISGLLYGMRGWIKAGYPLTEKP